MTSSRSSQSDSQIAFLDNLRAVGHLQGSTSRVVLRKECPVHGANYGIPTPSESFYGKEWCQHCTRPASELMMVEYVPLSVAEALADALQAQAPLTREGYRTWKAFRAVHPRPADQLRKCSRCGGVIVSPARHGEGWCIDMADQLRKEGTDA